MLLLFTHTLYRQREALFYRAWKDKRDLERETQIRERFWERKKRFATDLILSFLKLDEWAWALFDWSWAHLAFNIFSLHLLSYKLQRVRWWFVVTYTAHIEQQCNYINKKNETICQAFKISSEETVSIEFSVIELDVNLQYLPCSRFWSSSLRKDKGYESRGHLKPPKINLLPSLS